MNHFPELLKQEFDRIILLSRKPIVFLSVGIAQTHNQSNSSVKVDGGAIDIMNN